MCKRLAGPKLFFIQDRENQAVSVADHLLTATAAAGRTPCRPTPSRRAHPLPQRLLFVKSLLHARLATFARRHYLFDVFAANRPVCLMQSFVQLTVSASIASVAITTGGASRLALAAYFLVARAHAFQIFEPAGVDRGADQTMLALQSLRQHFFVKPAAIRSS